MNVTTPFTRLRSSPRAQVWAAVALAIGILIARKSWALHTPQLWAEDGTIHLNENDRYGAAAFLMPYRGYLHLIPRIVAWLASHTLDVAYWPALYNGAAFVVTAVLIARIASARLDLPGKPWLALSFVLVAHSGEAFLNITNLHWLTDIFLIQQVLMARPTTLAQRIGDSTLVVLAGLSDPCAIIFLPLFCWRWWRDRNLDHFVVALLVALCAATQAHFLRIAGLHVESHLPALRLAPLLEIAGARLIIWPFGGARAVSFLSPAMQGTIATIFILALIAFALRPSPRRTIRAWVVGAWILITFACVYRIRPDTWTQPIDDLGYAEPYFYTSRLLLLWLVIWEFDAPQRVVAWLARGACVVSVCLHLPEYRVSAPPDFHWAQQCDPIRQGVEAKIPILPEGWILQYPGRTPPRS